MPAARPDITVAFLTTKLRNTRAQVRLTPADGVAQESEVNLDSINTIPKKSLTRRVCTLASAKMQEVAKAAIYALDF
jgi:mRNA-degrading endonuclease toxin of MazEF toxin-antitoxin module